METLIKLLSLFLITITFHTVLSDEETKCQEITINEINYVKEVLKDGIDKPYNLAIDTESDLVYFSYSTDANNDLFKTAYINLNTKEFSDIPGVKNGFTQTIDEKSHEVYIGGSDGIFKYKRGSETAERVGGDGRDIWYIYFKDIVYYSIFPTQYFYTLNNGEELKCQDLEDTKIDQFVISDEIMYYTNANGFYEQVKGEKNATLIQEFPDDNPRCLIIDKSENVYLCLKDGIYNVNKLTNSIDKLLEIDNVYGLAFDNEKNIIYTDTNNVFRLNKDRTC